MAEPTRREKIEKMLAADPNDVFLLYGLAMEYLREGNVEEGLRRIETVIAKDPNYHSAYFQAAQVLAQEGKTDEARDWTTRGIDAAKRVGASHAADEMEGFLMTL